MKGECRNDDAFGESGGKLAPGNGAGWERCGGRRAAWAPEIKGVDFTRGAPVGRVTRQAALPGSLAWLLFR